MRLEQNLLVLIKKKRVVSERSHLQDTLFSSNFDSLFCLLTLPIVDKFFKLKKVRKSNQLNTGLVAK